MFKFLLPIVLGLGNPDPHLSESLLRTRTMIEEVERGTKDVERMWKGVRNGLIAIDKRNDVRHDSGLEWADQYIEMFRAIGDEKMTKEWEKWREESEKKYADDLADRKKNKHLRFKGDWLDWMIIIKNQQIAEKKARGDSTKVVEQNLIRVMNVRACQLLLKIAGYCSIINKYIHQKPARQVIIWALWGLF